MIWLKLKINNKKYNKKLSLIRKANLENGFIMMSNNKNIVTKYIKTYSINKYYSSLL